MNSLTLATLALVSAALLTPSAKAQQAPLKSPPGFEARFGHRHIGRKLMKKAGGERKQIASAIGKGLTWLAKHQTKNDGARESKRVTSSVDKLANSSLILLSLLGDGSQRKKGQWKDKVNITTKWLVKRQSTDGRFATEKKPADRQKEPLLGHALATYALAEASFMGVDNRALNAAHKAAMFANTCRLPDGTWPTVVGGKEADFKTTIWMLHAMMCAQLGDTSPVAKSITDSKKWLEEIAGDKTVGADARVRNSAGAFLLLYGHFASTEDEHIKSAVQRVAKVVPKQNTDLSFEHLYFGSNLIHQGGGAAWQAWQPLVLIDVRARLNKPDPKRSILGASGDALALMTYYRFDKLGR